jgi:4-amino-4-deoxy-L-arabinose transferase-like glycosyltransferase
MNGAAPRAGALRWLAGRIPELVIVLFAIGLRASLTHTFDVTLGYDFPAHEGFMRYMLEHGRIPPYELNFSTYNPPLFYALAALMLKAGFTIQTIGRVSIVSSCVQFLLAWLGLELYLRESRVARVLALALFAVLPAAVHIAGFASNQAFSDVFCTGAIVLFPQILRRRGKAALGWAAGAGACLGIALLTKITGATILAAFLLAVVIAIARSRVGDDVARAMLPGAALLLGVVVALSGWHYVRHRVLHGKFVLIAYDMYTDVDPILRLPYFDRRPFGFVTYWNEAIYKEPFWPSASQPQARFWPMLLVTTFSDYYNFAFVPRPGEGVPSVQYVYKPMRASAVAPARASVMGGTLLFALAAAAWVVAARRLWWRGDDGRLVLLLAALLPVLGQLHYAIKFPADGQGPIKGAYLQCAGPIYCALAGFAIVWLWNRRKLAPRALAAAGVFAIALVAAYTIFAKIVVPLTA